MFKVLFTLFIVVPMVEIAILIQLSDVIGGWSTIALVVLTAYVGAKMVKQQGLQAISQIQSKAGAGQIPGEELFAGVCILISGVLLLTPGIVTDILGFLLLTPAVRKVMAEALKKRIHLFAANPGQGSAFTFTSFDGQEFQRHDGFDGAHQSEGRRDFEQGETFGHPPQQPSNRPAGHIDQPIEGEYQRKD